MTTEYGYKPDEIEYRSGLMGVPITFLDRYNPDQFEIVGSFNANNESDPACGYVNSRHVPTVSKGKVISWNGPVVKGAPLYKRIIIRFKGEDVSQ